MSIVVDEHTEGKGGIQSLHQYRGKSLDTISQQHHRAQSIQVDSFAVVPNEGADSGTSRVPAASRPRTAGDHKCGLRKATHVIPVPQLLLYGIEVGGSKDPRLGTRYPNPSLRGRW